MKMNKYPSQYPDFYIKTVPVKIENSWQYKVSKTRLEYSTHTREYTREIESYMVDIEHEGGLGLPSLICYKLKDLIELDEEIDDDCTSYHYDDFSIGYKLTYVPFSHISTFYTNPDVSEEAITNKIAELITASVSLNMEIYFATNFFLLYDVKHGELKAMKYEWQKNT